MNISPVNNNYRNYNTVMFGVNTKQIGNTVQNATGKSGIYQAAVDKLADIRRELEYGRSLLRVNNWFNPADVKESDKATYEMYQSNIKKLEQQKKEVIAGMLKQIKEDSRYKDLSDDCMKRIKEHIDCGSTWEDFCFNDKSIKKIISDMKESSKKSLQNH